MSAAQPVQYRIDVSDTHAHTFRVTLTIPEPDSTQVVSLPVWIAGSYMVREFGRHLSGLRARQGRKSLDVQQLDKTTWQVSCNGMAALELQYEVYAFDTSVRTAFLSAQRGFFNNTSLCLRVHGREQHAHDLSLVGLPRGWDVATAMPVRPNAPRGHHWRASDYDELVDHPFELGTFWRGSFKAQGVEHEFVVAGAWPGFDGERLLRDSRRICEEHIRFWHGARGKPPFERYVFMLNAVDDGYGGLEHRASTALIAARKDLPVQGESVTAPLSDGYLTLLGLISHEYFHTWNVKRLKPAELCSIDHTRENYTELLWFFEGFTSYYDDLALVRCGLIDGARYLKLLAKTATLVQGMPGRRVQSVAQASFDAWNKYYRQDENTPNSTISYYTKGAQVALCLDLTLRQEGRGSLDAVMRQLWALGLERGSRRGVRGGLPAKRDPGNIGITEDDIAHALQAVSGRSYARELRAWVHGTGELPVPGLLPSMGIVQDHEPDRISAAWGLRLSEGPVTGCVVRQVLRGSAAEAAGLCAGDEILAVQGWRVRRLDDAARWLPAHLQGSQATGSRAPKQRGADRAAQLMVTRDQRILHLSLTPNADLTHLPTLRWALGTGRERDGANDTAVLARRKEWWTASA
jgi:predicted metalloprotease with PDZ domain